MVLPVKVSCLINLKCGLQEFKAWQDRTLYLLIHPGGDFLKIYPVVSATWVLSLAPVSVLSETLFCSFALDAGIYSIYSL